jgi:dCMP deaminase
VGETCCTGPDGMPFFCEHLIFKDESFVTRPSWDSVWMGLADVLSQRSTCSRNRVGCVVVSWDNTRVLSLGYNGGAKGLGNECLSTDPGLCGHLHAEVNALLKLDGSTSLWSRTMYVTMSPCRMCAVAIVNAGVDQVVYRDEYRDRSGLDLLLEAGLDVRRFLPRAR